jgi:anti-anti-sigma regulatory factor
MAEGSIYFAEKDGRWFFKLVGDVRYTISAGLAGLLDRLSHRDPPRDLVVDLSEASTIDSTNMGLLARLANYMITRSRRKPIIVCPDSDVDLELCSVGFDNVYIFLRTPCPLPALDLVGQVATSKHQTAEMVLEAHRALAEMNETNREAFRDVIEVLEKELGEEPQ